MKRVSVGLIKLLLIKTEQCLALIRLPSINKIIIIIIITIVDAYHNLVDETCHGIPRSEHSGVHIVFFLRHTPHYNMSSPYTPL